MFPLTHSSHRGLPWLRVLNAGLGDEHPNIVADRYRCAGATRFDRLVSKGKDRPHDATAYLAACWP